MDEKTIDEETQNQWCFSVLGMSFDIKVARNVDPKRRAWKCLTWNSGHLESIYGNHIWKIGKPYKVRGKLERCKNGFHSSKHISDGILYGLQNADVIAEVETWGDTLDYDVEQVNRFMRVMSILRIDFSQKINIVDRSLLLLNTIKTRDSTGQIRITDFIESRKREIDEAFGRWSKTLDSLSWNYPHVLSDVLSLNLRRAAKETMNFARDISHDQNYDYNKYREELDNCILDILTIKEDGG